jgi:hypothetical protein
MAIHNTACCKGGLLWRVPGTVRVAIQRLPFNRLQQYFARQIGVESCQQARIQDAPADDGKQGRGPDESLEAAELARLDARGTERRSNPAGR